MSALRVAVVGSAAGTERRARLLAGSDRLAIAAVGFAPGHDWRALVRRADIDAVVVSADGALRPEVCACAIDAGKHVLCDAPVAPEMGRAEQLMKAAARERVVLFVSLRHRYRRSVRRILRWIADGHIGEPMVARIDVAQSFCQDESKDALSDPRLAADVCGADLAGVLLGPVASVAADSVADAGAMVLRGTTGRAALMHSRGATDEFRLSIDVVGRDGYARASISGIVQREVAARGPRDPYGPFRETVEEFVEPDDAAAAEYEAFGGAIDSGSDNGQTQASLTALRIVLAGRESIMHRRSVSVQ